MSRVHVPATLRRSVIERAQGRCEYCLLPGENAEYPHEIDHFVALKHDGKAVSNNLVLACMKCNRRKGSDLSAVDPISEEPVGIFNPRTDQWKDHFALVGALIIGRTSTGRATVDLLQLNSDVRVERRQAAIEAGRYPPP